MPYKYIYEISIYHWTRHAQCRDDQLNLTVCPIPANETPNVIHVLLVVGARLPGSEEMGGLELLVQNS